MTNKGYITIAYIVGGIADPQERERVAKRFCVSLKAENPRFKENVFLEACNVK